MKNILLIGDSIRSGYGLSVQKSMDGIANVYWPNENCRFASYVLRYIIEYKDLIEGGHADVVHWNAGLWDCLRILEEDPHTPIDVYKYYIDRCCQRIQKLFPDAKVIFATSTSVLSEKMSKDFKRYNEEIEAYNQAAVSVVQKYGFEINDLYALSLTLPEEAHSDPVHYYTPLGTEAFTKQVLAKLAQAIDYPDTIPYQEEMYTNKPVGI